MYGYMDTGFFGAIDPMKDGRWRVKYIVQGVEWTATADTLQQAIDLLKEETASYAA